jgi:flagellar basal-body rod modification protein FlgD
MALSPVSNNTTNPPSNAASAQKKATLNYDNFLKLFVTQLKNQDPTQPMDATQQMAQLASFSQVEQTVKTNANLEIMMTSQRVSQAAELIGKTVSNSDDSVKGIVKSTTVYSDGVSVTLDSGKTLVVGPGLKISG